MRTNNSDGTENTTSAPLDESEASEKEVLPTIITLIMFANTISALADSLMQLTHSLISLPFERAKRIERLISCWIFFYSRRRKIRISLTTIKLSFRLFRILSCTSKNCLCVSHSSCCAPPLFRVAYFSLCQPNRNKEKTLYLQTSQFIYSKNYQ